MASYPERAGPSTGSVVGSEMSGSADEGEGNFQPRVEAEEGDPTRSDYIIGAIVALVVVVAFLWAFGVISFG